MKPIFFDTWGWVAVVDKEDQFHSIAAPFYIDFLKKEGIPITTDYVLDETLTILKSRATFNIVSRWGEGVLDAIQKEKLRLERITPSRWMKAWQLFKKYQDKRDISFTDFTSFVVMEELKIQQVFTGDEHFEKVNMGFKQIPQG